MKMCALSTLHFSRSRRKKLPQWIRFSDGPWRSHIELSRNVGSTSYERRGDKTYANYYYTAGIPVESLKGSRTAVFSATMIEDYSNMVAMDPDNAERTAVTGSAVPCIIPNRISWYFDLRGPSIHVNTACSSSLAAVDMACKTLTSGDASCVSDEVL